MQMQSPVRWLKIPLWDREAGNHPCGIPFALYSPYAHILVLQIQQGDNWVDVPIVERQHL